MAPKKETDPIKKKEIIKQKLKEKKKLLKQRLNEKRARLVVKNLPFKVTEESLRKEFEKFGEVSTVELLRKPDGKLVGCGFIQFKLVQKAAKAKHHMNGKEFLGRNIIVDFSKPKNKYQDKSKKESVERQGKNEGQQNDSMDGVEIKDEDQEVGTNNASGDSNNSDNNGDSSESETTSEEITESAQKSSISNSAKQKGAVGKEWHESHDINEGKTIFIKNVPFEAKNEDLKECMSQFGHIYYALICIDKLTEHSKGTAFVKFVNKEDAEKALRAGTELTLMGNILDCYPALERNEMQRKLNEKKESKKQPKDSRNLYLVKEGVILAGTKAAEGVSQSDMAKRLQLEQYKTQMLRNLNMFVSRERLVVQNLPPNWDDAKFRTLLKKYGGAGAIVTEARVMRDMRKLDANGIGASKEYGFVTFRNHENALTALRSLNNNPNIFSPNKRPIVSFSIENKSMIKARQKRLEKSRLKNPKCSEYNPNRTNLEEKSENKKTATIKRDKLDEDSVPEFGGITSKLGVKHKMRSRYKLKVQAKLHQDNLKKEKKRQKSAKKSLNERKKDFIKQPRQKINKKRKEEQDNFSKLVNDYKKKLLNAPSPKKSKKWFE